MCLLLQYLCDCQVRHRIEAIVAFSDDFVAKLQDNQRFRYNEVMQALNIFSLHSQPGKQRNSDPRLKSRYKNERESLPSLLWVLVHLVFDTLQNFTRSCKCIFFSPVFLYTG